MGACTTVQSLQGSVRNLKGFEKISKVSWSLRSCRTSLLGFKRLITYKKIFRPSTSLVSVLSVLNIPVVSLSVIRASK